MNDWPQEEIVARAEALRSLMLDAAADQFAELQAAKAQIATLTAERDEARATLANVRNYIGDGPRATHSQVGLDILALLGEAHDGAAP